MAMISGESREANSIRLLSDDAAMLDGHDDMGRRPLRSTLALRLRRREVHRRARARVWFRSPGKGSSPSGRYRTHI